MPNTLNADGLEIASLSEIVAQITAALQAPTVYGATINVNPNTPDGQMINIFAQAVEDMLETLLDTYNIFFVDSAYGVILDQLVALNGLTRKQGSFTQVYIQVTVTQAVTLAGQSASTPFTVADGAGNQFQLVSNHAFGAAGTATLLFDATVLGQIQVMPNTITNVVTTTLGVSGVNNPAFTATQTGVVTNGSPTITGLSSTAGMTAGMAITDANVFFPVGTTVLSVDSPTQITASVNATGGAPTTENVTVATPATVVGTPEETDVQLKVRRAQSFYLQTVGPSDAVAAALLALGDVADAYVAENDTGSTVGGVPAHGIWVIVNGGTPAEIAQAIYATKMPGCALKGSQTYTVVRPQGNAFVAQWDNALPENFYVRATLNARIPGLVFDLTTDEASLASALLYKLGQSASIGDIIAAMAAIEPNAILSTVNVSTDGVTFEDIITPSDYQHFFFLPAANVTLVQA